MRIDREYHHFKGEHLTRAEWVERFVVDQLVHTNIPDDIRESSQAWELMHSSTCKAFMHVLAEKRGVDVELARVAGALHDYYVIKTGKYSNHAQLGAPLVREILVSHGRFSDAEIRLVSDMVANHSDKHIYSNSPHVELVKDADVFDCSLYHGTEFYYLTRKPLPVCHEYFVRVLKVREELGMPLPTAYQCLSRQESGGLEDMGTPVPMGGEGAPSTAMLALWALATSDEGRDWPLIVVRSHHGLVQWYGPKRAGAPIRDQGVPPWSRIQEIRQSVFECIETGVVAAQNGNVRELFERCCKAFLPTWSGQRAVSTARAKAAVVLRDFGCDPRGDERLAAIIDRRIVDTLERPDNLVYEAAPGWALEPAHVAAVDELARIQALAALRGDLAHRAHTLLEAASGRMGRDLLFQFPSDAFACESSPRVEAPSDAWLVVAWPRFSRFEFLIGAEADDRFAALVEYFKDGETTK